MSEGIIMVCIDGNPKDKPTCSPELGRQLYRAFEEMGASVDLLAIIGSIGDTLSDKECADMLKDYNDGKPTFTVMHSV